ncbi:MAG: SpoIID/LytB domain-containing protein [Elusimicrobia bacterium]|nr:SpoIID/LytB domain-containing protein [Elusimicrobiota bacterium]
MRKIIHVRTVFFGLLCILPAMSIPCLAGPDYSTAYGYYLKGELDKSAGEYLRLAQAYPRDIQPLLDAAVIYKSLGRSSTAIELFEKALKTDPYNPDISVESGWIKFHEADYQGALSDFSNALRINPLHERALLGIGSVYSHLGKRHESLEYLEKYRKIRPGFAGADYIIAWNYVNFKMYKEAEGRLIEALRKDPFFIEARLPLAGIYVREHKFNEAWNQYYRILDYAPGHPFASEMVKMLEGKLTKQPEEIRPPFKITRPPEPGISNAVSFLGKSINLRVGIGANMAGSQGINKTLKIRSFHGFILAGKLTGKIYADAEPDETWSINFENNKLVLKDAKQAVYGRFTGPILLRPKQTKTGSTLWNNFGDGKIAAERHSTGSIVFERIKNSKNPYFANSDREFRGIIELYPVHGKGIGIVNIIDLETYLLGVVPSEMISGWPLEALKAQSVIARTQAVMRRALEKHKKEGYHICDSQHCQVYKGVSWETPSTNRSVIDTQSEILTFRGKIASPFYHSSCGGYIQASSDAAGWGSVSYLDGHPDKLGAPLQPQDSPWKFHLWITGTPASNCNYPGVASSAHFRWLRIIKHKDIEYRINREYNVGPIKAIIPLRRGISGNVNSILIKGVKKSVTVTKEHLIRNIMGFASVKSTLFEIEINKFKNGNIRNYWIYGGGWGHGIGLCQSGAAGLAGKYWKKYKEILDFYFPGTKLRKMKYVRKN